MFFKSDKLKKLNRIIGIEISENDVIGVELLFIKDKVYLKNGFRLNVPVFQDPSKTISLIKQTLKSLNIKTKECVIGFSLQYLKLLSIPIPATIPQDEIPSIIAQEGNIDPVNESVTYIQLNNTQRTDPDGTSRFDVLGIAIHKQLLGMASELCKSCNLKLVSVTPAFCGIGSFLSPLPSNELLASLWISQIRSEFIVWSGQEPIYEHLFFTHQLNDQLFQSISYIQTQLGGTQVAEVITNGTFVNETDLSQLPFNIQQFTLPGNIIDTGKVLMNISPAEIANVLGISFASTNIFPYTTPNFLSSGKVAAPPKTGDLKDIFKGTAKPAKGISKEIKFSIPFMKNLDPLVAKFIFPSVAVIIFSMLCAFYINSMLIPNVDTDQTNLEGKVKLSEIQLAKLLNIEKTNKVLTLKADYFSQLIDQRRPWSKILREIADITPRELWIDRLEIKAGKIDVFGRALNVDAVANFSINLNHSAKLLDDAQIIAMRKFQEENIDLIEFQINTRIRNTVKELSLEEASKEKKELPQIKSTQKT